MKKIISVIVLFAMMLSAQMSAFAEENAKNPYEKINFVDADYTSAGVKGGPMLKDVDGSNASADYWGLQSVGGKYAAFGGVELDGVKSINIAYSAMWNETLATIYIEPAGQYTLSDLTVTNGKIDGLTEKAGKWNKPNNSWDEAVMSTVEISGGASLKGTYDIIISFGDEANANYWYFWFDEADEAPLNNKIRFVDADYTNAGVKGGPMLKDVDGSNASADYWGLQDVDGKYAAFENIKLNGLKHISVASSIMYYDALSTIYIVPHGEYDLSSITTSGGKISSLTETVGIWNKVNNNWNEAVLYSADVENGKSFVGMYDVIFTFSENACANFWYFSLEGFPPFDSECTIESFLGEENMQSVSPYADKIIITFDAEMDESTINENNIYFVNSSGEKPPFTFEYSGGRYIMHISELLGENENYSVIVSKNVANSSGEKNKSDKIFGFKTSQISTDGDKLVFLEEDFEDGISNWSASGNVYSRTVDSNGVLSVELNAGSGQNYGRYTFDEVIGSGKIGISARVQPGSNGGNTFIELNDTELKAFPLLFVEWSGTVTSGKGFAEAGYNFDKTVALDKWYTVNAIVDLDTRSVEVTLTDEENDVTYNAPNVRLGIASDGTNISNISAITLKVANNSATTSYFDDISIKRVVDAPNIGEDDISFINVKGEKEMVYSSIDPSLSKIIINFNSYMNAETLDENSIYLEDASGNAVSFVRMYEKGKYTLYLKDRLSPETDYTLYISKDVENLKGETLANDINAAIRTTKGYVKLELTDIKVNNKVVESINQIVKGNRALIEADYINSTHDDAKLYFVVAYYGDSELKNVEYITKDIDKSIKAQTYTLEHTIRDLDGVDSISVMSWNGFGSMRPISKSIAVK